MSVCISSGSRNKELEEQGIEDRNSRLAFADCCDIQLIATSRIRDARATAHLSHETRHFLAAFILHIAQRVDDG